MSLLDKTNNLLIPSGYKAGTLYSVLPNTAAGDADVNRNSTATRIDSDGYVTPIAIDVPRLDYKDSTCPVLLTEDTRTNKVTRAVYESQWTKVDAYVKGDPNNAGPEKTTNGELTGIGGSVAGLATGVVADDWRATSTSVACTASKVSTDGFTDAQKLMADGASTSMRIHNTTPIALTGGKMYLFEFYVMSNTNFYVIQAESPYTYLFNAGTFPTRTKVSEYYYCAEDMDNLNFMRSGTSSTGEYFILEDLTVKEVPGWPAPYKIDGEIQNDAYKLKNEGDGVIMLGAVAAEGDIKSIWAKTVEGGGTGQVCILNHNSMSGALVTLTEEWQRFDVVTPASGTGYTNLYAVDFRHTSNTLDVIEVWGPNLVTEDSVSSTILIDTPGSQTTVLKDEIDGMAYEGDSESGVFFAEMAALSNDGTNRWLCINGTTSDNRIEFRFSTVDNTMYVRIYSGGTLRKTMTHILTDITLFHKYAIRWATNDISLWIDGVNEVSGTVLVVPEADSLVSIDFNVAGGSGTEFFGKVKQLQTLDYLTDAEMVTLTT